jgi:hypothetical protein
MRTIERVTDIEAHPSKVWRILSSTAEYHLWNPFITRLDGHFVQGSRLTVTIKPRNRPATFRPTVLAVEEGKLIRWRGRLGVRGIFDGDHELSLEELADGTTRFTQRETFSGILVPFVRRMLDDTEAGFTRMNAALRSRALEGSPSSVPR